MTLKRRSHPLLVALVVAAVSLAGLASESRAAAVAPWWHLTSGARPSILPSEAGAKGQVVVTAANLGDANASGETSPITITDKLPAGLRAKSIEAIAGGFSAENIGPPATCAKPPALTCTFTGFLPPYDLIEVRIAVETLAGAESGELNEASVSGGQATPASIARPVRLGEETLPFGLEDFELAPEEIGGGLDTQAGSHPFQLTTTLAFNQLPGAIPTREALPVALVKDLGVKLPPGLVGDPTPFPRCTLAQFLAHVQEVAEEVNACPPQTAVGVAMVTVDEPSTVQSLLTPEVPIFNLEPSYGEPARFGFFVGAAVVPVIIDTSVRSGPGEDYGITASSLNTSQTAAFITSQVVFWGTPGDTRHDSARGWGCLAAARGRLHNLPCETTEAKSPPALLTLPTSCAAPPVANVAVDSWLQPHDVLSFPTTEPLSLLDGCNQLSFAPTVTSVPTSDQATTPTGLEFDMYVNDEGLTSSQGLAQSQISKAVVALPVGVTTNPSVAAGLIACNLSQYESETVSSAPGTGCPAESKIGEVAIETPLVSQKIRGSVFLAKQDENPFGSLLALYVVAKNPELGVLIRVAGKVTPDPVTGQLVTTFEGIPQLPFSHFHFAFRQGQRAPLATPPACGTYTTQADLTPYSNPAAVLHDTARFTITSGPEGGPCPSGGVPPFAPGVTAGTLNNDAASYSPMYLQITRKDTEQEITRFSSQLPPGLTANLSGVPFCPDQSIAAAKIKTGAAEEAEPSCPAASQIGHTEVGVGVGTVLAWSSGKLYLGGPYNGAPFSVVAINSAKIGPFDLGTVVVREALAINPETAAVTVDAKASDPIPHILDGIVIHARDIRVYVDRPNFTLNPTNCDPMRFSATVDGAGADPSNPAEQMPITVNDPFQVANCANLQFKPLFKVFTSGKTSRKSGASLSVSVTYPKAPQGSQADIRSVKVDLPKQLPSRLTTLQKACTSGQFEANPAACPAASRVGNATAVTPILPVPLTGPAYFVSHGGAKFPELVIVLQGYGVTIELHGETFINEKTSITSSTFRTVPDQPVTSFQLTLPQGRDSALAANGNLCKVALKMPTQFTGQNGMTVKQNTPIRVTNCPKHKARKKAKKTSRRHRETKKK